MNRRTNKKRYVPDIGRLMADCEANYARLLKLLPSQDAACQSIVGVTYQNGVTVQVKIVVTERFKYTSTVCLTQEDQLGKWLSKPELTVRLYHDAAAAEVIHYENMKQLNGSYGYPNSRMYHSDEKVQLNAYLSEWLSHCLHHGHLLEQTILAETA